ncbi:unnamed protein product [Closterium sp. NIES-54]
MPFFEGCSPSTLAPSYASTAAADIPGAEDVGATSASAKRRSSKGKGGKGDGGGSGSGGGSSSGGSGGGGGGGGGGTGGGVGGSGGGGGGSSGSCGSGGGGTGDGRTGARRGGSRGGQRQQQQRRSETQSPQQLREWLFQRGTSGGSDSCPYVIRTGDRAGQTCGRLHTQHRCFSRLDDAWRAEFGDEIERPRLADLLRYGVAIFDLDFDVILSAMYALSISVEGDGYRCVPPDPGIAAAALGASESGTLPGTARAEALHTFTLDSGASRCFFRDSTTLTPLPAPVLVRLADPSGGPDVAHSSTVLPCLAVAPPCSCRLLSHQTLLWHHRLGHPSLPRLRGMHSRLLLSGLPKSLPPLPPSPAPPCLPCVEGRQRAAPHSSSFPPMTAPLHTLHMDMWGPSRVSGQGREHYFLLVVDDYMRYTTVFPLCSKGQVVHALIPWIHAVRLQLHKRFRADLLVLRLHSDRGGEFSSDLLQDFCRGEGILQSFTLPDSPQQNGIAERRIGLVMEVARTSMIHAAAPRFLWPFAVRYAAHQLNLWPHVSLPEISPTLRWTGKVGDASVFRVWGSRAFVRDTSADKFSARAIPSVFLGFVPDAPGWQFYLPTSRRVLPSQDVTSDKSVPFYRLFPYRSAPLPPPPLFLAPGPPPIDPLPPQGPAPSGVSLVDPPPCAAPGEVAVDSGAARGIASGDAELRGAKPGGAAPGGAETRGAEPGGAETKGVEPGGAESEGAEFGGAEPGGAESEGAEFGATRAGGAGAAGAAGAGAAGVGGARTRSTGAVGTGGVGDTGAGDPTEPGAARAGGPSAGGGGAGGAGVGGTGAGGAGAGGTGAGGAGVGGTGAGGARAGGAGAVGPGGIVRPRPYFVHLLEQVLGVPSSTSLTPPLLCPPLDQSQLPLLPASSLPTPSPYTKPSGSLTERREPASRPVSPVCNTCRVPCSRPPPVPGTYAMTLRPSSAPLRVPLPDPLESSLPAIPDLDSDRPHYATALVAESAFACPPSVGGECALGTDVLEDRQEDFECLAAAVPRFASMLLAPEGDPDAPDIPTPRSYAEAITGPYSSQRQAAMDAKMASWKSTSTYVDHVPPPGANIVDGMWIFRVKRPPGYPLAFKARYVARGFSQRQGVDYFQTFSPTPKMTALRVLLHVAAQRDYELHSLDFSTTFLQGTLHEEIWLRRPPGFSGTFPAGTQWSLRRPVYGLRQAPRKWHGTLSTTLAALGFAPSTTYPSLFLRTDTSLPPFYVLVYVDDLVYATAYTEALTLVESELQKRHTCTDLGELRSYLACKSPGTEHGAPSP